MRIVSYRPHDDQFGSIPISVSRSDLQFKEQTKLSFFYPQKTGAIISFGNGAKYTGSVLTQLSPYFHL